MIGEILTWAGVAVAALATYGLYRSAERSNVARDPENGQKARPKTVANSVVRRR